MRDSPPGRAPLIPFRIPPELTGSAKRGYVNRLMVLKRFQLLTFNYQQPPTTSEVSRGLGFRHRTVASHISTLCDQGFLRKRPGGNDQRRRTLLSRTWKGLHVPGYGHLLGLWRDKVSPEDRSSITGNEATLLSYIFSQTIASDAFPTYTACKAWLRSRGLSVSDETLHTDWRHRHWDSLIKGGYISETRYEGGARIYCIEKDLNGVKVPRFPQLLAFWHAQRARESLPQCPPETPQKGV